ncbi:MAG: polysaccharide deacetylase family protein [Kiritimatiellae bacterium]|nr:polysaccharide deacetylase family protein [Kiritimatiellia bacterium]
MKTTVAFAAALCAFAAVGGEQLMNLPPAPKEGRFKVPADLVWPEKPGEADVCLWSGDRFAACSITIDDNCKPDHEWWLKLSEELGIKLTWFVITDGVVNNKNPGFAGTWADWQKIADAGHSIQSHTTNHKAKHGDVPMPTDEEVESMYRDSLKAINDNVKNNFACCIAYPRGEPHEAIAAKYAIACRGVYGVPSCANSINYLNTNKGAGGKGHVQMVAFGETEEEPKWVRGMKNLKRGWNVVLYHMVHAGRTDEDRAKNAATAEKEVRYIASLKDERLWVCRFDDAVKYGQERDSATLTSALKGDKIEFTLTDRMKDEIFDFPLTVKVRLPDGWTSAKAAQGGKSVPVRFVSHDGAPYALVEAVPDKGAVVVVRGQESGVGV